ncbi:alpha/beta hydrolase [Rhodococcus opacus]|nr:alpha/beta hydrolase [Rhodococcus opacus]RZL77345.1 MAG: alpha/beta hydrolase [Rhodococcus sp. (in: high G+C Gram-positive bacteria)]
MTDRATTSTPSASSRFGTATPPYPVPKHSHMSAQMHDLQHGLVPVAEGVRLHYVVAGEGDPVLLIPGWPQSWYAWRFIIPLLVEAGRRVYAIDPRGFGDSDMPSEGYGLDNVAEDVHVLIEQLGLAGPDGLDIVSHDTGSWIAHAHAAAYPQDVRTLVLSDAHIPWVSPLPERGYPDDSLNARQWHFYFNRVEGLSEALIHGREREFLSWFFGPSKLARTWVIDSEAFEEYLRVFSKPGAVRAGLNYYREVFSPRGRAAGEARKQKQLSMPILTLGGSYADADNLFHTMRQFSTDVRDRVFEGIGHHLPEECPEEMAAEIVAFWAAVEAELRQAG